MDHPTTRHVELNYVTEDEALSEEIIGIFATAFKDDPGIQYLCQAKKDGYDQRLLSWFRAVLRLQMNNAQPLIALKAGRHYVACATLTAPHTRLKLVSLALWVSEVLWRVGPRGVWRTMVHIQRISRYQPAAPHFRLEFIAVIPSQQGKGYGRVLLDEIHSLSQRHQTVTGVWLETTNPANVPLYERFGYRVVQSVQLGNPVTTVVMFRANVVGTNQGDSL